MKDKNIFDNKHDDWLKKELIRESKISVWDFDDRAKFLREDHYEHCEREDVYQEHYQECQRSDKQFINYQYGHKEGKIRTNADAEKVSKFIKFIVAFIIISFVIEFTIIFLVNFL